MDVQFTSCWPWWFWLGLTAAEPLKMAMFSPKKKLKVGALLGLMFTWEILLKCSSESKHGPETQGVIKTKQLLTNYMKWPQNAKEIPHLRFLKTLWAPHVVQLSVNFWYLGLLVLGANLVLGSMLVGNHWSKVAPKLENSLLIFFSLALASQPFDLLKFLNLSGERLSRLWS